MESLEAGREPPAAGRWLTGRTLTRAGPWPRRECPIFKLFLAHAARPPEARASQLVASARQF